MKIQTSLILTVIFAALTGISLKSQPNHERARIQHDVLILQGGPNQWVVTGESGQTYQWDGYVLFNAESSAGAPKYVMPVYNAPYQYSTNRLGQAIADNLDAGFVIKQVDGSGWSMTVTMVRER